eukprot:gnl/TRDRNA2_/TRDRNA2_167696_c0_seq2.p1 gnl/TRDRNA2_/TRDRNA2_167696_c0~~gnl/TRDRNA2_/TRDRNA2_167696_c0_seq2.p1  ORF type:complete len:821 (-),score=137.08 gnl/TRDRNA2_/TRDRNA2_167696_c0_seq2:2-2161(-)
MAEAEEMLLEAFESADVQQTVAKQEPSILGKPGPAAPEPKESACTSGGDTQGSTVSSTSNVVKSNMSARNSKDSIATVGSSSLESMHAVGSSSQPKQSILGAPQPVTRVASVNRVSSQMKARMAALAPSAVRDPEPPEEPDVDLVSDLKGVGRQGANSPDSLTGGEARNVGRAKQSLLQVGVGTGGGGLRVPGQPARPSSQGADADSIDEKEEAEPDVPRGSASYAGRFMNSLVSPVRSGLATAGFGNDSNGPSRMASQAGRDTTLGVESSRPSNVRKSFMGPADLDETTQQLMAAGLQDFADDDEENHQFSCISHIRRIRLHVWLFMEEPFLTPTASCLSFLMVMLIFASILNSVFNPPTSVLYGDTNEYSLDTFFNAVFLCDFLIRFWAFPRRFSFFKYPKNAIDLICVLPWITIDVFLLTSVEDLKWLRFLPAFNAFLRLCKLSRYFWGWNLLYRAVKDSAKALIIPLFFLVLIIMGGACLLYVFERIQLEKEGGHLLWWDEVDLVARAEMNLVTIQSLFDAVHFSMICILSLSTGPFYGLQAASPQGRLLAVFMMVFGMIFMAMPITIVGGCFSQTWFDQDRISLLEKVRSRLNAQGFTQEDLREVFDEVDEDGSGEIDINEFKKMIKSFNLRSLNTTKIHRLFHYFDADADGTISFSDFALTLYPESLEEHDLDDEEEEQEQNHRRSEGGVEFGSTWSMRSSNSEWGSGKKGMG